MAVDEERPGREEEEAPGAGEGSAGAAAVDPSAEAAVPADAEAGGEAGKQGGSGPPPVAPAGSPHGRPAPAWVVPLYVVGLVLVYLGERVLSANPTWHWVFSGTGLAAVVLATGVRFSPRFRVGGERRHIERLLAALSITGLVGLALYFATTDWGTAKLGLDTAQTVTRDRVEGVLTVLWIALVGLSVVPMLFAEGALYPMRHAERPESRRVRAAAASGLMLVLAAVYGALFVYAAQGVDLRVDYSYFKTSKPSESTRKMADALDKPVKVIAFFPDVNDVRTQVKHYLDDLSRGVPKLQVQIKDRLLVPKLSRKLHAMRDGIIVLAKGETTETLDIGTDMKDARPKLKTLDRDFQAKLLKLVRSERTAYLTVGHGEISDAEAASPKNNGRSSRIARLLLQRQNYVVKNLGLSQGLASDVPKDADLVLILGPSQPFAPEEVASLQRYVKRGGHVLMALDPDALPSANLALSDAPLGAASGAPAGHADPPVPAHSGKAAEKSPPPAGSALPAAPGSEQPGSGAGDASTLSGLEALAHVVGLTLDPAILANDRNYVRRRFNDSDRVQLVTNRFSSHASVSTLSRNASRGAAVVVFGAGSLERAPGSTDKVDFAVRTMPGTFADENHDYKLDDNEKRSIFNIAAAVESPAAGAKKKKPASKKGGPDEMRAFVLADADAFSDLVLGRVMTNQLWFVDAVRWLGGEESFAGEVNTEEDVPIQHTKQKDLIWFYATIFGAPALVLGLGLLFSRRSRRPRRRRRSKDKAGNA
jgi:hypothetical protein